jgi:hypothetical protein
MTSCPTSLPINNSSPPIPLTLPIQPSPPTSQPPITTTNTTPSNIQTVSTKRNLSRTSSTPRKQRVSPKKSNGLPNKTSSALSKSSNNVVTASTNNVASANCAGCERPILDQYLYNVLERTWHQRCIQCSDCKLHLAEKCFSRDGKIYCKDDFFR